MSLSVCAFRAARPAPSRIVAGTASILIVFACQLFLPPQATAITKVWVGGTGDWNTSENWLPTGEPTSPDDADISNGGTAVLNSPTLGFWGTPRNAYLGKTTGTTGNVDLLTGGRLIATLVVVGDAGTGSLDIDGTGSRCLCTNVQVGNFGVGTVNITAGGIFETSGAADVAAQVGSTGTVHVTGTGSQWDAFPSSGGLDIGQAGTGYLYVENGGLVYSNVSRIGTNPGEGTHGTVVVDAGTWNSVSTFTVGVSGEGTLTVENAGNIDSGNAIVADVAGSIGDATVTGQSSVWTPISLIVAKSGVGTLNIWAGGRVSSDLGADIGDLLNAIGIVNVDGTDGSTPSKLTTTATLNIGDAGNGTLNISGGALVEVNSNADAFIGNASTAEGIVNVTGGGTLKLTDELLVGWFGKGTLNLNTGGSIQNVNIRPVSIGRFEDSIGIVNVGAGSSWNDTADLTIGDSGRGEFHLTGGGDAQSHNVSIGNFNLAEGIATVGPDSTWTSSGTFYVGESAQGTLQIEGGGLLQTGSPKIGAFGGSAGTAIVTGQSASEQPSRWLSTGDLDVGYSGAGNLQILAGAYVENLDGQLGGSSGVHGIVEVSGQGSLWKNNGVVRVGHFGSGEMNVRDGGVVQSAAGHVGYLGDGESVVTIEGKDIDDNPSSWINNGDLTVGDGSNGNLRIRAGGFVQNVNGIIGYDTPVKANVEVVGAGSLWRNTGSLRVGYSGDGSLDIFDGGTVESGESSIGYDAGSRGRVFVTGNSTWKITGGLTVGGDGPGELRNWGTVESGAAVIGDSEEGEVIVDDESAAMWKISGELRVGNSSSGDLYIRNGRVENTNAVLARLTGSEAFVDVWQGAVWKSTGELQVGRSGTATLRIGDIGVDAPGAVVENTNVDFAEHYYHSNYVPPFTNGVYEQALNGDLAQFHPIPESEPVASHAYPYIWYTGTAGNPLDPAHRGLGIQLSQIYSGAAPSWQVGNTAFSAGELIVLTADDAASVTIDYTPIHFGEQTNVVTGDVEVEFDSATLTTHSPAIITSLLDVDDAFSAITFDMEFLSSNPGLLSVYLGSEQIFSFENEFYAAGPGDLLNSGLIWLSEEMSAGPYSLSFRLDPLGTGDASIEISNLQFVTLTEVVSQPNGDFNADGIVDTADYVMWRKLGLSQDQYNAWHSTFGQTTSGSGGTDDSLVPEPSSMLGVVIMACAALTHSRLRIRP